MPRGHMGVTWGRMRVIMGCHGVTWAPHGHGHMGVSWGVHMGATWGVSWGLSWRRKGVTWTWSHGHMATWLHCHVVTWPRGHWGRHGAAHMVPTGDLPAGRVSEHSSRAPMASAE
eukprot:6396423-Prymnesium_polylepis.1